MITVTKSFLPPIEEYMAQVQRAYNNEWLTNRGELVRELETGISNYLNLRNANILCTNNGTIPLQIALKSLGRNGEVITTPFSYVATTAAIVWEGCTPVFVDIHPEYLTIDETKIEEAITSKTTCILATHVYGNPCNVEEIERIAKKHNLKVIYDAAHCFGIKYKGKSIFEYGDVSTCSFHATKIFHTGEGGAIICKNEELFAKLFHHHNFGHDGPLNFNGLGINGKMSELHAAMGLCVLPYVDDIIEKRKNIIEFYNSNIINGKTIRIRDNTYWNSSYFPLIFKDENSLLKAKKKLEKNNIHPRRYFYPSLNQLKYLKKNSKMIESDLISKSILCLPNYFGLKESSLIKICSIINNFNQKN